MLGVCPPSCFSAANTAQIDKSALRAQKQRLQLPPTARKTGYFRSLLSRAVADTPDSTGSEDTQRTPNRAFRMIEAE